MNRLEVTEHHSKLNKSEVVRIAIKGNGEEYNVIIQNLASRECVVVDIVYPDENRLRVEQIYYGKLDL